MAVLDYSLVTADIRAKTFPVGVKITADANHK